MLYYTKECPARKTEGAYEHMQGDFSRHAFPDLPVDPLCSASCTGCTAGFEAKDGRVCGGQRRVQEVGEPRRTMKGAVQNNTLNCLKQLTTRAEMRMRIVRVKDKRGGSSNRESRSDVRVVATSCAAGICNSSSTQIYEASSNLLSPLISHNKFSMSQSPRETGSMPQGTNPRGMLPVPQTCHPQFRQHLQQGVPSLRNSLNLPIAQALSSTCIARLQRKKTRGWQNAGKKMLMASSYSSVLTLPLTSLHISNQI